MFTDVAGTKFRPTCPTRSEAPSSAATGSDAEFLDQFHLNLLGVTRFTEALVRQVVLPLLQPP